MNEDIGYLIKQISDRFKAGGDAALKEYDLTFSQLRVLGIIGMHGGRCMQKDIESSIGVSHPAVVGLVSRLEANGFVVCSVDPQCRRNKIVTATEKAEKIHDQIEEGRKQLETQMLSTMTPEEASELRRLLHVLIDQLNIIYQV